MTTLQCLLLFWKFGSETIVESTSDSLLHQTRVEAIQKMITIWYEAPPACHYNRSMCWECSMMNVQSTN
jgi:hypothetical protein